MNPSLTCVLLATAMAIAAPASAQTLGPQTSPGEGPRTYEAPVPPGTQSDRILPAPDSPPGVGPQRTDPGRDCAGALGRINQTICTNADLRALDRDVARLAAASGGRADHAAWSARLEACAGASNTVYDGPIYNCLRARYEARLVQLARLAGGTRSGQYRLMGGPSSGTMTVAEWPDRRVTVMFNHITAEGARACGVRMDVRAAGALIEGSPQGLPGCRIAIDLSGTAAAVRSNGCQTMCEMGHRVDGTYASGVAPAARPSGTAPQR